MVSVKIKLGKKRLLVATVLLIIIVSFVSISVYQWTRLANEEYFYDNPKRLYERLKGLPSDLNIENVKRIKEAANPQQFKFVVMGDSRGNNRILMKIIKEALSHRPDFIIFLGDLTEQGKLRHYIKEVDFIKKNIPVPFVFVIGNHDYYNNGYLSYTHIFGPLDFYFDIGRYRFICIDNNFMEKVEELVPIPERDMEWEMETGIDNEKMILLDSLLKEDSHINIILMHQPPPLNGWKHYSFSLNGEKFLKLVQRFNSKIPYVCAAHLHGYDKKELYGVKFIVSGGAGAKQRREIDHSVVQKHNYILFEVSPNGIKDEVYFVN